MNDFEYVNVPMVLENGIAPPSYKTDEAACADISAFMPPNMFNGSDIGSKISLPFRASVTMRTGIKMEIPLGYKLCMSARSGLANRGLIVSNAPAQIDGDYRGEILVILMNMGREIIDIKHGDRIAQCWLEKVIRIKPVIVTELSPTKRGENGLGSTGV